MTTLSLGDAQALTRVLWEESGKPFQEPGTWPLALRA